MTTSDRFHHEDDVLAAYEEAEAALWRALSTNLPGELIRVSGESRADTVQRVARSIADAVIRSRPMDMDEDITTVPGVKIETVSQ